MSPMLTLTLVALFSGGAIALRSPPRPAAMTLWTFDSAPLSLWKSQAAGQDVAFELMGPRALNVRLQSIFAQPRPASPPPDVVAIEIGSAGRYLRGDAKAVPLYPLDDFLARSPLRDRLLQSRRALWRYEGVTFGVPLDTHPVTLSYRVDLFDAVGIDLAKPRTWLELRESLRSYLQHPQTRGDRKMAIELPRNSSDVVMQMLLQQHLDVLNGAGEVDWSDKRFARTIAFYATMVAGPQRVAGEPAASPMLSGRDLENGAVACFLTPDWRVPLLRRDAPALAGKLAMRPLPSFGEGDAPVSTWGGTMLAIPRSARDPEASWRWIESTLLSDATLAAWPDATGTLTAALTPPSRANISDPLFTPQRAIDVYADLAPLTPARTITPFTTAALAQLSIVVGRAADYVGAHGEAGLEDFVRLELDAQAGDLRRRIAQFDSRSSR